MDETHTLGLLRELRELAEEISGGHSDYAERFQRILQAVKHPALPDVAKGFGFTVRSDSRTLAVCSNLEIARAAYDCACKIYPKDDWVLLWGGMIVAPWELSNLARSSWAVVVGA